MTCCAKRLLAPTILAAGLALGVAQSASAAAPTKLAVSYAEKTVDFLPLLIASDAGYFKKRGLDVTVSYLPAQEGIPALLTGQVQLVGIGGADALSAEAGGAKLKLVATLTPIYIFQFWTRPQYAKPGALKGQLVGLASTTGSLYAGTVLALKDLGLKTSDVALTPLGSVVNVNSSLIAGSIAAAASHPPATYQMQRAGLIDIDNIAKRQVPSVSAGVWASQAFIEAHRAVMQKVVDAVIDAINREKSDRSFTEAEISKYLGVKNKAALDFTYDFYIKNVLPASGMPKVAQLKSDQQALIASNPKVKTVDIAAMIDQSFVKNVQNVSAQK